MSKQNKGHKAPAKIATQKTDDAPNTETTVQAETVVKGGKAVPGILKVKAGIAMRGARAAWYEVLQKYDGKPVAEYMAHCDSTPPSVPKSGVKEKPSGWVRYFQRVQACEIVAPATATE